MVGADRRGLVGREGLGSEKERREEIGAGRRQGVVGGVIGE